MDKLLAVMIFGLAILAMIGCGGGSQFPEKFAGMPTVTGAEAEAFRAYLTSDEIDFTGFGSHESNSVPGFSESELTEVCRFYADHDWPVPYKEIASSDFWNGDPVMGDWNAVGQRTEANLVVLMDWSLRIFAQQYAPNVAIGAYFQRKLGDPSENEGAIWTDEQDAFFFEGLGERQQQLMKMICSSEAPRTVPASEQAAVAEYASAMCDPDELPNEVSWHQIRARYQASLDRARAIDAPAALRDFHIASQDAMEEFLEATADFDLNAVMDVEALFHNEILKDLNITVEAAMHKLDGNVFRILLENPCAS